MDTKGGIEGVDEGDTSASVITFNNIFNTSSVSSKITLLRVSLSEASMRKVYHIRRHFSSSMPIPSTSYLEEDEDTDIEVPLVHDITIYPDEWSSPKVYDTGLLDQDGEPIYAEERPSPIGFLYEHIHEPS